MTQFLFNNMYSLGSGVSLRILRSLPNGSEKIVFIMIRYFNCVESFYYEFPYATLILFGE